MTSFAEILKHLITAVDCGAPVAPKNGQMNGTSFRYGDEVTFSCTKGFQLVGSQTLKCIASGVWIGNVPECTGILCSVTHQEIVTL